MQGERNRQQPSPKLSLTRESKAEPVAYLSTPFLPAFELHFSQQPELPHCEPGFSSSSSSSSSARHRGELPASFSTAS